MSRGPAPSTIERIPTNDPGYNRHLRSILDGQAATTKALETQLAAQVKTIKALQSASGTGTSTPATPGGPGKPGAPGAPGATGQVSIARSFLFMGS